MESRIREIVYGVQSGDYDPDLAVELIMEEVEVNGGGAVEEATQR